MTINPFELDELLTRKQAAEYLKISTRTLDKLIKAGDIHAAYVGSTRRILKEDLLAYLRGEPRSGQPSGQTPTPTPLYRTRAR